MANEKYLRELRKKKQGDTGAPKPGAQPVSQTNAPSAQSMGGGFDEDTKYYIKKGQGEAKKHDFYQSNVPPSMRRGSERQQGRETKDWRSVSDIGGDPGLLTKLERGQQPVSDKADSARQTKLKQDRVASKSAQAKKDLEEIYGQFGMKYEEGGEVKSKVMSMLDGMKDMPAEAEVVKMIVEKHGVSEDEAKAMIAEYKQSKMGGEAEYEGGGAMKLMRDPKDMVGMTMAGGAKIIS